MTLSELMELSTSKSSKKQGLSEERLKAIMPQLRQAFSCWREYPDLFVDFLVDTAPEEAKKGALQLYFYQRVNVK